MIKVSLMYPNREGAKFDMVYYCDRHIPMVQQLLGWYLKEPPWIKVCQVRNPVHPPRTSEWDICCLIQFKPFGQASARMRRQSWRISRSTRTRSHSFKSATSSCSNSTDVRRAGHLLAMPLRVTR